MTIAQINSDSNSLTDKFLEAVDKYKSKLIDTDTSDFADYLNENYSTIDKDKNNSLSMSEINESVKKDAQKNPELQKILDNKNIESLISNIDLNNDGEVSQREVNPASKAGDILKSAVSQIGRSNDWTATASNITKQIGQSFYLNNSAQNMLASAVNYIL